MQPRNIIAAILTLPLLSGLAMAHEEKDQDRVGTVQFQNSCAPEVQQELTRGVAMLHSFWFTAGEQTFRGVLAKDPSCGIADWGIASVLMQNALAGVGATPKGAEQAQAAIDAGRQAGTKTQRERDYIEAVAAYYQDWAARPEKARQLSRALAYEALAAKYPDDDEAQIFSALYTVGTQSQADQTYAAYKKAAAILEKEFAKYPNHPGVAHYLIHAYDAPPLAQQGLAAARLYANLAPDAPHALHMPSHIFTRVGEWSESAATNRRSFDVAIRNGDIAEAYHASDYEVYAYLQLGRDDSALAGMRSALANKPSSPVSPAYNYAAAAMPARYALERGDWCGAMLLEPAGGKIAYTEALTWFARSIGAARCGDAAAAERNAAELTGLYKTLVDSGNAYWAKEVDVQRRAAAGWIAFANKHPDEGLRLMREAADMEDQNEKHIVTPGRVLPARELLGDMLMEAGQPALAMIAYEMSQQREPNRFRGYYGVARAAAAAGDKEKASASYAKLLILAKDAEDPRPELTQAKAYTAR